MGKRVTVPVTEDEIMAVLTSSTPARPHHSTNIMLAAGTLAWYITTNRQHEDPRATTVTSARLQLVLTAMVDAGVLATASYDRLAFPKDSALTLVPGRLTHGATYYGAAEAVSRVREEERQRQIETQRLKELLPKAELLREHGWFTGASVVRGMLWIELTAEQTVTLLAMLRNADTHEPLSSEKR